MDTPTAPTLRTGRLYWLARYFEQHPKEYNQATFCGAAMCVGGLTVWQWGTVAHRRRMARAIQEGRMCYLVGNSFSHLGKTLLGLTPGQTDALFSGAPPWLTPSAYLQSRPLHARQAAATLRHLARTGEVLTAPPAV